MIRATGHFAGGNGSQDFCRTFKNDLVKRTNAAITIEHLGLKQWEELPSREMGPTGQWEAVVFAPGSKALVHDSFTALRRGGRRPRAVAQAPVPQPRREVARTSNAAAWPCGGPVPRRLGSQRRRELHHRPLNWGITTKDSVHHAQVRRQAMAFTQDILRLARTRRLTTYTL